MQIFDHTATKLVYPKDSFRSGYLTLTRTIGYEYVGLVVSSLALANSEATITEIVEWEIYGTPYGCTQVCMHMFCSYFSVACFEMDTDKITLFMQCASGSFSASGVSVCTACSAGKYLTSAAGGTEAGSCTSVS